jgi:hypothetical protein
MASITFPLEPTPTQVDLTGTDFEVIGNSGVPATDEFLLVEMGKLYSPPDEVRRALRYTGSGSTTGVKIAEATAAGASSLGTLLWGPAMLDASGNGYAARVNEGAATLYVIVAYNGTGEALDTAGATFDAGAKYRMHWDQDTGEIEVYVDETLIMEATDTTYDGTDGLKESVFFYSWDTSTQGITMFATEVDSGSPTPGLRLEFISKDDTVPDDDTDYTVVVRDTIVSTSILFQTTEADLVSGRISITDNSVGDVDDTVHVTVYKEITTVEVPDGELSMRYSGYATVVDMSTGDLS